MADSDSTALVLDKREKALVVQSRRKSLRRVTAASGSFLTIGIAAAAMILLAPVTVPMWIVVPFCLGFGTLGGAWFGDYAGQKIIKEDE